MHFYKMKPLKVSSAHKHTIHNALLTDNASSCGFLQSNLKTSVPIFHMLGTLLP